MTPYRGSEHERPYRVAVLVDGLPLWAGEVDARSSEGAAITAFCEALHKMLAVIDAGRTPPAPPAVEPAGSQQLRLLLPEDDKSVSDV